MNVIAAILQLLFGFVRLCVVGGLLVAGLVVLARYGSKVEACMNQPLLKYTRATYAFNLCAQQVETEFSDDFFEQMRNHDNGNTNN